MGKKKHMKSPSSPPDRVGRDSQPMGSVPRTGPTRQRYDNPDVTIRPIYPGNPDLTMVSKNVVIPKKSFVCGKDSPELHEAICTAMYQIFHSNVATVFPVDQEVAQAIDKTVTNNYAPKHTGDDVFSFAVRSIRVSTTTTTSTRFTFAAATKYLMHTKNQGTNDIFVYIPADVSRVIWDLASSVLLDHPDDEIIDQHRSYVPPKIKEAYSYHIDCVKGPTSPYKKFTDTVFLTPDGSWNSSITLFTVGVVSDSDSHLKPDQGDKTKTYSAAVSGESRKKPNPTDPPQSQPPGVSNGSSDTIAINSPSSKQKDLANQSTRPNQVSMDSSKAQESNPNQNSNSARNTNPKQVLPTNVPNQV